MQHHRKILFLPRWYPNKYGVQNGVFIQKHARAAAVNNEVVVLFAAPSPTGSQTVKSQHGNLTEVFVYYKSGSFRWLNFIRYLFSLFKGWSLVSNSGFRPDSCHVNMLLRPAMLALWLKWRYGIPYILTEHWSGYVTGQFEKQSFLKKALTRFVASRAAVVTAVSGTLKEAMSRCGLNGNIRILPNVAEALPGAWKQKPVSDIFRFIVVADLNDEIKNVSGVIRAFIEVRKQQPEVELVIVGDGKDRKMLESSLTPPSGQTGGVQAISFLGEKSNEEVLKIIPAAHVLIVNSRIETFSVVTLESILSGRPVIATRCGGPEQFINEQNGVLVEKDNDKQLAEAMIQMKNNFSQYPSEKVKDSLPNNYELKSVADLLSNLYADATPQS